MRRVLAAAWLCCASGCGEAPRSAPAASAARSGKAELFADATLIPTRAGEHARRELAVEAELGAIIDAMGGVRASVVSVRLPRHGYEGAATPTAQPSGALIAIALAPDADGTALRREVGELSRAWLGGQASVHVIATQAAVPAPEQQRPWTMIALALLGLGASVGVTIDRAFDRRRASKPAPRVRAGPSA